MARRCAPWIARHARVLALCQFLTVVPLFLILGYIAVRGAGGIDWDFFTKLPNDSPGRGLAHAFVGSFILVGLATAFAVPVGILVAVFLAEYRTYRMVAPIRDRRAVGAAGEAEMDERRAAQIILSHGAVLLPDRRRPAKPPWP